MTHITLAQETGMRAADVLVRVSAGGVCGSDTHYYRHGQVGGLVVEAPLVLGHEAARTIAGAEALDSDRTPGSVKSVVQVS